MQSHPTRLMIHVAGPRSEEHTSELQSQSNLVCRLLLEKKKTEETERRTMPHPEIDKIQDVSAETAEETVENQNGSVLALPGGRYTDQWVQPIRNHTDKL